MAMSEERQHAVKSALLKSLIVRVGVEVRSAEDFRRSLRREFGNDVQLKKADVTEEEILEVAGRILPDLIGDMLDFSKLPKRERGGHDGGGH